MTKKVKLMMCYKAMIAWQLCSGKLNCEGAQLEKLSWALFSMPLTIHAKFRLNVLPKQQFSTSIFQKRVNEIGLNIDASVSSVA